MKYNNNKIGFVVAGIVVLIAVFYGGIIYGKNIAPSRNQGLQAFGPNNMMGGRGLRNMGGFTTGQVIAKDATSITVSVQGGGSKIIFLDNNTKVSKQAAGIIADLVVGTEISVTGTTNTDGSVNAQSVQIRPNVPATAQTSSVVR